MRTIEYWDAVLLVAMGVCFGLMLYDLAERLCRFVAAFIVAFMRAL